MTKRKRDKRTNNDLQNIAQKTEEPLTRSPLKKPGLNSFLGKSNRTTAEVPVLSQESERSCICALGVSILFL